MTIMISRLFSSQMVNVGMLLSCQSCSDILCLALGTTLCSLGPGPVGHFNPDRQDGTPPLSITPRR